MKFKIINSNTEGTTSRSQGRYISLTSKGQNGVSSEMVTDIKLQPGNLITFLQDQDEPTDWYVNFTLAGGFKLRETNGKNMKFSSSMAARSIFESLKIAPKNSIRFPVSSDPVTIEVAGAMIKAYALITHHVLDQNNS